MKACSLTKDWTEALTSSDPIAAKDENQKSDEYSWEAEYAAYCEEQEQQLEQKESTGEASDREDVAQKLEEESWELQYAQYCAEKEARLAEDDAKQREARQQRQ